MDVKFNCQFCSNSLVHDGLLLNSYLGPIVMCLGCRALYYLQTTIIENEGVLFTLIHATIGDEDAFDIIRRAEDHKNFGVFLAEEVEKGRELQSSQQPQKEENLSDVREVIKSCTTPADLIRRLGDI